MFIHNYSHTFFLLLRGPIFKVVLHDCRQRDVSQTLMSIHGWVRGFRMCKTSSLQLLLGQLGTSVGSHPSEELENVHWLRGAWSQQHGSIFPWFRCLLWKAWFVVGCLYCHYILQWYTSHFIWAKSKAAAPFRMKICWALVTSRMVRVWLGGYRLLATMNLPSSLLAWDAPTAHSKTCTMPRPRQSLSLLR